MAVITLAGSSRGVFEELLQLQKSGPQMGAERIDALETDLSQLIQIVSTLPMFDDSKQVIVNNLDQNKLVAESVEQVIESSHDGVEVIFVAENLDKRTVLYKTLKSKTDFREHVVRTGAELARWLVEIASEQGSKLSVADANYLIDRVGGDENMLKNEIQKMSVYKVIDRALIDDLTAASIKTKVFDLLEAALAGNSQKALSIYQQQRQLKVEPAQILSMFSWQLQMLTIAKLNKGSLDGAAKQVGVSPYALGKSANIARKLDYNGLVALVDLVLEADRSIKVNFTDPDETVQLLVLSIANTF